MEFGGVPAAGDEDQAGWHTTDKLEIPKNLTLLPIPPVSPELNAAENIWQYLRQTYLSNRVFKGYNEIIEACCEAVLLAVKNMGGESEAAWRALLDDLVARGLKTPEFLIVDGAAGLEKALAALWPEVPTQRCTVHKHRNLLAHAPDQLHEEVSADYTDMIYAATPKEVEERRRAFIRKWRLKCRPVADSLEEAGDRLFTFTRLPFGQWRSARTSNAVERLHEEFKRRIKTQTVLPSPESAAMLFWALLASGQITMRKVDGWQTLATKPTDAVIDVAA